MQRKETVALVPLLCLGTSKVVNKKKKKEEEEAEEKWGARSLSVIFNNLMTPVDLSTLKNKCGKIGTLFQRRQTPQDPVGIEINLVYSKGKSN